jgi:hypothetical protein
MRSVGGGALRKPRTRSEIATARAIAPVNTKPAARFQERPVPTLGRGAQPRWLDAQLARDIETLEAHGGLVAVCAAIELFGRKSGFEIELRNHFRKCAAEADPAALTFIAGAP